MRHTPPESLVELLGRLGLATADDFRAVAGRARRLARDLPLFESVWVDALAQARILSAFQASEINARRGARLRLGPYVLQSPLGSLQYAHTYAAHAVETGETVERGGRVLLVSQDVSSKTPQECGEIRGRLEKLIADSARLDSSSDCLLPVVAADIDAPRAWAVCRDENGVIASGHSAIEWIIHNGRFRPPAVLEIARAMTAALAELQQGGRPHGDIRAATLLLSASGRVLLPHPGLRAAFRPAESHATAELPPEAYDGLAPERSARAVPANLTSDVFACGCLWWHLLTARPALPGGNGLAKMRAALTLDIPPVKPLAADTPQALAAAIEACTARDPAARPQSFEQLAEMLGSDTRTRRRWLNRSLRNIRGTSPPPAAAWRSIRGRQNVGKLIGIAAALALLAGTAWLVLCGQWTAQTSLDPPSTAAKTVTPPRPAVEVQPHEKLSGAQPTKRLLDGDTPLDAGSLRLRPGQTVSAKGPGRACLLVPGGGMVVDVDDVRFENIDFVWKHARRDKPAAKTVHQAAAIIDLRAASVQFHGCTFSSRQDSTAPPVAIRWTHPLDPSSAELSLPSGSIRLENCVFNTVSAAVDCHTAAAISIATDNVLHLGSGPLVRLHHLPRWDEPLSLSLSRTTLRDSGPLLQCPCGPIDSKPARLEIEATASVFMPAAENGLIVFSGRSSPQPLLQQLQWSGQGSLVAHKTPIAQWLRGPDSAAQTLSDDAIAIAGLVRGDVQFAAAAGVGIAASQITKWQAPLKSPHPPGVDVKL